MISNIRNNRKLQNLKKEESGGLKNMTYDRAKTIIKETLEVPEQPPNIKKEYMNKYQKIKDDEFTTGVISKRNWNGKDVWCSEDHKKAHHVNKIINELNNKDILIYISGM